MASLKSSDGSAGWRDEVEIRASYCCREVGRRSVLIESAGLVSFDPDANEIARDIVAFLQTVERIAGQKLLRDLTLEFDAMGSITGHELSSFESPACRSNVKSETLRRASPLELALISAPAPGRLAQWSPTLHCHIFKRLEKLRIASDKPVRIGGGAFLGLLTLPVELDGVLPRSN